VFKRSFLIVLDGWGVGSDYSSNAIAQAETPCFDRLMQEYPNSQLVTYGLQVGLPEGQMGNSEVGHLNLGAGRVVYQDLVRINLEIQHNRLIENETIKELAAYCIKNNKPCHLIGLVSDGGVHSHIDHLKALIQVLEQSGVQKIYIHVITDGRDTDPHSGIRYVTDLENFINEKKAKISSVIGRYYAMDRDKRWERVQKAYDLLVSGKGKLANFATEAIESSYRMNVSDEFIDPYKITPADEGLIHEADAVLCFNYRTDRLRQLTQVLNQPESVHPEMKQLSLYYVTLARYDHGFKNVHVVYEKQDLKNTLGEILSVYGYSQLRIAETEKYPHVSYFFSGGREQVFSGENRLLVPSPKVATYDLQPEMSAVAVTEMVIKEINFKLPDFICLNFANADMVGHTGVFNAEIKAVETIDQCLNQIIELALQKQYAVIILADHGNGEFMINADGTPNTAHTKNPVPCILVSNQSGLKLKDGKLADIAPTILKLMSLPVPVEMDGLSLLIDDNTKAV
jgi:2,3-bisphosphoglycerate-independent phosphoglycerate mutase